MITTIFSKTRPFNYILLAALLILCFIFYGFCQNLFANTTMILSSISCFVLVCLSALLVNFIGIRNNLTKNNTYTILFCFLFIIMFPQIFQNVGLVFSNFLILLAFRRLVAVQSLKNEKQKIFDASILIFISSLFEFWTIVFVVLVFIIIVFYVARDYRNWIIPSIALVATAILFICFSLQFQPSLLDSFLQKLVIIIDMDYFSNSYQNIAFSVYATVSVLFLISLLLSYSKKPLAHQALFRFIIFAYIIGIFVFSISPQKNNSFLIFTFAPLSIMASNFFENIETDWILDISAILIILLAITCFIGQL